MSNRNPIPNSILYLLLLLIIVFFHKPPNLRFNPHSSSSSPIDPYKFLNITLNPDGSITRHTRHPTSPATATDPVALVWSKDLPLNPDNHTWLRLYLPRHLPQHSKLPVILYFHGGGFVFLSADHSGFHAFCDHMAATLSALVVSVEYRLAPEHRLPAAYEDAAEALDLLRTSTDPWISAHADLSRCVLMGESAGGNIAYHAGLRAAASAHSIKPLQIRGLVLIQPYFGGSVRTGSETRLAENRGLPMSVCDLMWELSLPVGAGLDHEYCNPKQGGGSEVIEKVRELGWRVVITGVDGDPLYDREVELGKTLGDKGVRVTPLYRVGYYHGVFLTDRELDRELFHLVLKDVLHN